ncbi:MAG: 50S ribosomal protein L11 [Halobacteriota archaeon]|nr:50S ribosomal protein L11 [Halobacteriota archaeon]
MTEIIEALVPGGSATAGPPIGPALGPMGVNIKQVVDEINEKTKDFGGMQVPVKIIIGDDKSIGIEVGTPPTSALIMQELGIQKGSSASGTDVVGDLSFEQVIKVARMKIDGMLSYSLKNATKEVIGTCVTMGVQVEGMSPKDAQKAVSEGRYDDAIQGAE